MYLLSLLIVSGGFYLMSPISGRTYSPIPMTEVDRALLKVKTQSKWLDYTQWLQEKEKLTGLKAPEECTEADYKVLHKLILLNERSNVLYLKERMTLAKCKQLTSSMASLRIKLQKFRKKSENNLTITKKEKLSKLFRAIYIVQQNFELSLLEPRSKLLELTEQLLQLKLIQKFLKDELLKKQINLRELEEVFGLKVPTTDLETLIQETKKFNLQRDILFYTDELKSKKVPRMYLNYELGRCKQELQEKIQKIGITPPENCTEEDVDKLYRQTWYIHYYHSLSKILSGLFVEVIKDDDGMRNLVICKQQISWILAAKLLREVESDFGKAPENCTEEDLKMIINQFQERRRRERERERERERRETIFSDTNKNNLIKDALRED